MKSGSAPTCRSEECAAERRRQTNRELERRYFAEHGEYRARAIERANPAMRERAAERNRRRNAEIPVRKRYPAQFEAKDARRRLRKRAGVIAKAEPIVRREVFEACGWVCALCRKPVNRLLRYPHPRSASLDHIVPLSRGGLHIRSNVQLAHLDCNVAKSDRLLDERALAA